MSAVDINQAVALLDRFDFWVLKASSCRGRREYECAIRHDGKLCAAYRRHPVEAVNGAIAKYEQRTAPKLRLARKGEWSNL